MNKIYLGGGLFGGSLAFLLPVLLIAGWIMNIIALCQCDFKPSYKAEVIRGVGVAVPFVGAVTGWINIEDGEDD